MAVAEDVWDQLSLLDMFKEGRHVQAKIKNSLRSFTFTNLDRKKIRMLNELTINFAILKPDKGNGIVLMKRSDYIISAKSLFNDTNKLRKIVSDPIPTRLSSLQNYFSASLKKR